MFITTLLSQPPLTPFSTFKLLLISHLYLGPLLLIPECTLLWASFLNSAKNLQLPYLFMCYKEKRKGCEKSPLSLHHIRKKAL